MEGPHRVYTPCPGNHLIWSSCKICWRHEILGFNVGEHKHAQTQVIGSHLSCLCQTIIGKNKTFCINSVWWGCFCPLTPADSHHTLRCLWSNSCPSGSGWWVHSPDRACTSAGSGPLWSDCSGRARTGHPLHNQSHIPGGINGRNTPGKRWGRWFGEMCSWRKEGLNVDYRGSRIKEWSWLAGSEENNGQPLLRVHLTLAIISLTLSVWMSGLPLQDPERPGIWIIKALGDTHCCIIASLLLRFLCGSLSKQTQ